MSRSAYRLIQLANGAFSIHSVAHSETFHPVVGPVAEAEALYVRQLGLPQRLQLHQGEFVIWDVGLGAAANPLAVLRATAGIACPLRILSFDQTLAPLQFALGHLETLTYLSGYEAHLRTLIDRGHLSFQNGRQSVAWELRLGDFPSLLDYATAQTFPAPHAILFDAFSPAKNPAMWTAP